MSDIKCRLCLSPSVVKTENFRPYTDVEWVFDLYKCETCQALFSERDNHINYFEILYQKSTNYERFSSLTNIVSGLLSKKRLAICRQILCSYYSYAAIIKTVEKLKKKQLTMLEIGSSTGFLTAYFNKLGHKCLGVEISEKAVAEANEMFGPYFSTTPVVKSYDVIYMCGIGGGLSDISQLVKTYLDMLKPGGLLVFNVPNLKAKHPDYPWLSTPPPDVITLYHPDYKELWFADSNVKADVEFYYEVTGPKKPYKYPLTLQRQSKNDLSLKYKSAWHFIVFNTIKSIYLKLQTFTGRAKLTPAEYGLIVKLNK